MMGGIHAALFSFRLRKPDRQNWSVLVRRFDYPFRLRLHDVSRLRPWGRGEGRD